MKPYELEVLLNGLEAYKKEPTEKRLAIILEKCVELLTSKAIIITSCTECPFEEEGFCSVYKYQKVEGDEFPEFCQFKSFDNYLKLIEEVVQIKDNL